MTLEQRSSGNEVSFNDLPAPVRKMILSMHNNIGCVIGALEIRGHNEIYFQSKKVVNLPAEVSTTSQDTSGMIIRTTPAVDLPPVLNRPVQFRPAHQPEQKIVPTPLETTDSGEIPFGSLPPEAQNYITNMLGSVEMELTVAGKRLALKKHQAYYDGRLVVKDQEAKTQCSFDELPDWAKAAIRKCLSNYEDTVQMRDGGRLIVSITNGPLQVSFNKVHVTNIP